ncbi:hypothetical protein N7414_12305 [Pseudomonas sp. GD04087]|uniref:hypothetical protein n=1 Tax=Pseudomonas TaxID=286 RepID=UPI00244C2288|nr:MULTISPECIES: hypothetical protein [Pseudomonas]MCP1648106.1 hypothetical protein [Pseudomonas nitroreducens]MCP1686682.1 hypothetical protein [Pseudomonas nitroreducens]MDH0289900.1 hypothetical protein [Pseudomonas sp. GD04087]MDH1050175.1 hypothetical protein [Pseudomonas sp. GD03903]MDH2002055.1 hypothetical protein [Pseudomonas sp. GD03691]
MTLRLLSASLLLACTLAHAAEQPAIPRPLEEQVGRLVELYKDSFATGYPAATRVQTLKIGKGTELTLAVFTIEGFDMGNNYNQYLAVFSSTPDEEGQEHFSLLDAMQIGGGGWRSIEKLDARLVGEATQQRTLIDIPVMQNSDDDSPNFPSRAGVIHLSLQGAQTPRLVELN